MNTRTVKADTGVRLPPREIAIEALLQGRNELVILHNEQRYVLRLTSNKKLILTR